MRENDVYIFVPSDFDLWPLDLTFAQLVAVFQHYVPIILEVSNGFPISRKSEARDGQTDIQYIRSLLIAYT